MDRRLGRLVPPGDEPSLIDAMNDYCNNIIEERNFAEFRRQSIDRYSAKDTAKIHAYAIAQAIL